ncbi:MAG: M6 family metalloprotease domain-containing protein, partial [archaeon]
MNPKIIIVLFLILLFSNVFADFNFSKDNSLNLLENKDNLEVSNQNNYQDVFYPPEEVLLKEMGITTEQYKELLVKNAPVTRNSSVSNIWGTTPLSGTIHIPVLLVQFTDKMPTQTQSAINEAFNSSNYLSGSGISVSKYYTKQSYGDLNIIFDVYNWTTMPNTFSYYSQNSNSNFYLIIDAMNTFNPSVNFAQYDNDNDGRLDGIVIVYPDQGKISPNGIWAQTRILKQYNNNPVDGKYLGNAALIPSLGARSITPSQFEIPVTTHEFAHVLGIPDLYANGSSGQLNAGPVYQMTMMIFQEYTSPTNHCLNKPINLDVWSRYFFGWVNPIELTIDSNKEISLRSINDYPDAVILRNSNMGPREFFIIENRYRNTADPNNLDNCMFLNGSTIRGGFAIYHVDENKIEFDYPNNWVNWDRDNNYFDYTTWPGIIYRENMIDSTYPTNLSIYSNDLYFNVVSNGCDSFRYFDSNKRICATYYYAVDDSTTRSYNGTLDPLIKFEAISTANLPIMTAKMLVGEETIIPAATPIEGTYTSAQSIVLSSLTPGATIYYTTNGTTPTTSSTIYVGPITAPLGAVTTIKAIAKKNNFYVSDVMTSVYTIYGAVATPTSSQPSGNVAYNSQVILSTTTTGATIRYT